MADIKIVGIADTHMSHEEIRPHDGDILVVAGDFCGFGRQHEVIEFNRWLGTLPHEYKIVVAGNHDLICQDNATHIAALFTNAIYLDRQQVTVKGIKFYGMPWTPQFLNWAFMYEPGSGLCNALWGDVHEDTNILISHGPPHGTGLGMTERGEDVGCWTQRQRILELPDLRATFCGHIHGAAGISKVGKTVCHNVSVIDEGYVPWLTEKHGQVYIWRDNADM